MPAIATCGLSSALRTAYSEALQRARLHFGRCRLRDLGSLVVPFTRVNWTRYRNAGGNLSEVRVSQIMHVLERACEIVPDVWWWRKCAAEASAINVLLRDNVVSKAPLRWTMRVLQFVEAVLPKEGLSFDLVATTLPAKVEMFITHERAVWQLKIVPSRRGVPLLGFFRLTSDGAVPLLVGTWSREFWLRLRDLVSEVQGLTPLAHAG